MTLKNALTVINSENKKKPYLITIKTQELRTFNFVFLKINFFLRLNIALKRFFLLFVVQAKILVIYKPKVHQLFSSVDAIWCWNNKFNLEWFIKLKVGLFVRFAYFEGFHSFYSILDGSKFLIFGTTKYNKIFPNIFIISHFKIPYFVSFNCC